MLQTLYPKYFLVHKIKAQNIGVNDIFDVRLNTIEAKLGLI